MNTLKEYLRILIGEDEFDVTRPDLQELIEWARRHFMLQRLLKQHEAVIATHKGDRVVTLNEIAADTYPMAQNDARMLAFEADRVERALGHLDVPIMLLKGASYVLSGHEAGKDRRVSDIDILVHEKDLLVVEKALLKSGWNFDAATSNDYDQHYYRSYMHELPPLRHSMRGTVLDVHHRILPRTSKFKSDAAPLWANSTAIEGTSLRVMSRQNMFIHASVHVFLDGYLSNSIRSLHDLFKLYSSLKDADKQGLLARADMLGVAKGVHYALWSLGEFFDLKYIYQERRIGLSAIICWCVRQRTNETVFDAMAHGVLYIRSHYLRMPFGLLAKHMLKKLSKKIRPSK